AVPTHDGRAVAVASGNRVYLWDIPTGRESFEAWGFGPGNIVRTLAVSPNGTLAVSATPGPGTAGAANKAEVPITLFPRSGSRRTLTGHGGEVSHMAFLSDTTLVAVGSDQTIRAWDTTTGRELHRYPWPGGTITALIASPDGTFLTAVGWEKKDGPGERRAGVWAVWTAATVDVVLRAPALPAGRLALAVAPDNRPLALVVGLGEPFADTDGATEIRLWDVADRKELRRWQ